MDSTFKEKIVRRNKTTVDYLKIVGMIIGPVVFLVIVIPYIPAFAPLLIIGFSVGAWWLITGLNREYEYIITDQFIDIDCIIAKRKRTRVFSGDAKEFEICGGADTDENDEYLKKGTKVLNFAPTENQNVNYFIITKNNAKKAKTHGQTVMLIFEPEDTMIKSLRKYNPSRFKTNRV